MILKHTTTTEELETALQQLEMDTGDAHKLMALAENKLFARLQLITRARLQGPQFAKGMGYPLVGCSREVSTSGWCDVHTR